VPSQAEGFNQPLGKEEFVLTWAFIDVPTHCISTKPCQRTPIDSLEDPFFLLFFFSA